MRRLLICVTLFAVVLPWANVAVCSNLSLKESQILLEECLKVAETAHEKRAVIREFYGDTPELRSYILSMDASIKSEVREPRCGFIDSLVAYQVSLRLNKEMHRLYEIFASKPAHLNTEVHDTNFQVWYTTDDQNYPNDAVDKAYAEEVLDYYKKARAKEIDSWDYRPGKSKGQNKFQIWIYDMGSLGKCGEFEKNSGATGDDPRTYCVNKIMPDLDSSYDDSLLLSTCAHEYHHASQVAYIDPSSGYKLWILEASTPWMGYEVRKQYPSVNGLWSEAVYEDRYDYWQEHSDQGIESTESDSNDVTDTYDACILIHFLTDNTETGSLIPGKPQRNVVLRFWEKLGDYGDWGKVYQAFNGILSNAPAGYQNFEDTFENFVAANYTPGRYYPAGEVPDQVTVKDDSDNDGITTTLSDGDPPYEKNDQSVNHWGASYWVFSPDATVAQVVVKLDGENDWWWPADNLGNPSYQILLVDQNDQVLSTMSSRDVDHTFNIPISSSVERIAVIVAALSEDGILSGGDGGEYGITVEASTAQPNIITPTESAPDFVGKPDDPSKTSIEVEVKTASGTFITGLTKNDFEVTIGGVSADIVTSVELADKYVLNVQPPDQSDEGLYNLEVTVFGESDSETDAIQYADTTQSNVDVVLTLDRSGSMSGSYIQSAKNAASLFVDQMENGDQVGVVSFSSSASLNYGLTEITGSGIKIEAQNAISSIYASGMTSIGAGLNLAQSELTGGGADTHPWAIVLLSDGYENTSPYVSSVLPDIVSTKTKVFTIALGSNSDQALLQDIASQTNGQYYLSPTEAELAGIYSSLSGQVAGLETLFSETGTVQQGAIDEQTVNIDPSVEEAIFSISWSGSGNDLDLALEDPNGTIIDSTTSDPNITFTSGSNSESFTVSNPPSGTWIMRIYGGTITSTALDIPLNVLRNEENWTLTGYDDTAPDMKLLGTIYSTLASGLEYNANVTAQTPLTMNTYLDKSSYVQGEPILIAVAIADLQPITGATVVAQVTTPSSSGPFSLYDDGLHGDAAASDGIYGNAYTQTGDIGTYSFEIEATGTGTTGDDFSRVGYASTVVKDADDVDGDNMPDDWESNVGLDPTVDDSADDPDVDGLTNLQEYQNGTDPFSSDTDADGLTDGEEVNTHSTDPTKWDTDCGGESDGSEVDSGRNPLDPTDDLTPFQAIIDLNAGWNLISLYTQPDNTSIETVLGSISGKYSSVWAFMNNSYRIYVPDNPGLCDDCLSTMEAGWGYWLNMNESETLRVSGSKPPDSVNIVSGWNLAGYNSTTAQSIADALASIAGKYVSVWVFIDGGWKLYDPADPGFSDLTIIEPGYGYWINATEACTWTLP